MMKIIGLFCFLLIFGFSSLHGATLQLRAVVPSVYQFSWNGDTINVTSNISSSKHNLRPKIYQENVKNGRLITIVHP